MLSLILSTIAFFVAAFLIGRQLDNMDMPRGMTRSMLVFTLAAAVSYGVAVLAGGLSG
jgi:VIT1/CCC1 family predicted Fe2+/Mn2+ transporter